MAANELQYICKRTVVSTKPVLPGKYYRFSVLDRTMERNHVRMVYYYRSIGSRKTGEITKMLKDSLSEMLTNFPAVTGRLIKEDDGKWMIKCNDAGMRIVEAKAKCSIETWLESVDREKELKLVYWEEMYHKPYFWSTFYVQLTEFEDGGLAIGLSCMHLLADPICAIIFFKAWANITLNNTMQTPPFFHPLPPRKPANINPNHNPYTQLIDHYKSSLKTTPTTKNYITTTFSFTDSMVRAIMTMARVTGPSPFDALAGLFWVCLTKIKGTEDNPGLMPMSICLDMRRVLRLDEGYFGNCMVYNKVKSTNPLTENSLSDAALAIGEVVEKMDNEGIMDLIEWLGSNQDQDCSLKMNGCDLICFNLEGVDPFSACFEDGVAPIRMSCYVEPVCGSGQVLILSSPPDEGPLGRVVMVTLPEEEMTKLREDDLIKYFSPFILM